MGQSLVKNYIHVVFSTKHRKPLIDKEIESDLNKYLGGICRGLDCDPIQVGGYHDHIHILCLLSKKMSLVSFMKDLKSNSSKWIKTKGEKYEDFFWQDGYGAFSISPNRADDVTKYIANQHQHHKQVSFQDEYRALLKEYQTDFDEKYLWD